MVISYPLSHITQLNDLYLMDDLLDERRERARADINDTNIIELFQVLEGEHVNTAKPTNLIEYFYGHFTAAWCCLHIT